VKLFRHADVIGWERNDIFGASQSLLFVEYDLAFEIMLLMLPNRI
jgi:hypothetical protein